MCFPRVAEAANRLAQAHGEVHDGLKALGVHRMQPFPVRENEFGIAQNSGEWVIDFVAKDFGDVAWKLLPWRPNGSLRPLRPSQPAFDQRRRQRNVISSASHEVDVAFRHQPGDFHLALGGAKNDDGRGFRQLPKRHGERDAVDQ